MNIHLILRVMTQQVTDKKEAIYEAAIKLLNERGFHSTPMSLIAKEANVAAGTIYLYFKNKEEMLNKLYLEIKEKYSNSLMRGYLETMPVRDAFELVWRNSLDFKLKRGAEFGVMEQFKNSPFIKKATTEEGLKIFSPVIKLVERAKREKIIKDYPDSIFHALFFAPVGELVKTHTIQRTEFTEEEKKLAFQGCWNAVKN